MSPPDAPAMTSPASAVALRASRREIFGWAMFDFANQAYTLLIITVVFGELFTTVIEAMTFGWPTCCGASLWR